MKKVLKWLLIVIGGVLLLVVIAAGALTIYANASFKKTERSFNLRSLWTIVPLSSG